MNQSINKSGEISTSSYSSSFSCTSLSFSLFLFFSLDLPLSLMLLFFLMLLLYSSPSSFHSLLSTSLSLSLSPHTTPATHSKVISSVLIGAGNVNSLSDWLFRWLFLDGDWLVKSFNADDDWLVWKTCVLRLDVLILLLRDDWLFFFSVIFSGIIYSLISWEEWLAWQETRLCPLLARKVTILVGDWLSDSPALNGGWSIVCRG